MVFELKEAIAGTNALAVMPCYQGKRGHPIALKEEIIRAVLRAPNSSNLKQAGRALGGGNGN
ncbi:MAG: hypothetical protein HY644_12495 [Acidobacteria bacterium]|nr:hypothetical protein [Acidobacteriota bacterium]